jgi:hypothetical protein
MRDDARGLWQGQPIGGKAPGLEEVRRGARAFERTIRRRNLREYVAAALVTIFFGWQAAAAAEPATRIGAILTVAGTAFIVFRLRRHGSAAAPAADLGLRPCLDFHRAELERQRDLLRSVWYWYLLPLVPGLLVMLAGRLLAQPQSIWRVGPYALVCAAIFFAIARLNSRAARELQREIDALEEYR